MNTTNNTNNNTNNTNDIDEFIKQRRIERDLSMKRSAFWLSVLTTLAAGLYWMALAFHIGSGGNALETWLYVLLSIVFSALSVTGWREWHQVGKE